MIFRDVYPRFEGGRFDVTIDRMISDDQGVLVEYTARGKLTSGSLFECGYAAVLEFVSGKIERVADVHRYALRGGRVDVMRVGCGRQVC